jgi:hypothetical protein
VSDDCPLEFVVADAETTTAVAGYGIVATCRACGCSILHRPNLPQAALKFAIHARARTSSSPPSAMPTPSSTSSTTFDASGLA